jgi:DNA-binding transcriptional ArsR family regulator
MTDDGREAAHALRDDGIPRFGIRDTVSVLVDGEAYTGSVRSVDTYGDTTDVERVVTIAFNVKHEIDESDGWVPWKGFLVEEPASEYRFNLLESNGQGVRTLNLGAVEGVHHEDEQASVIADIVGHPAGMPTVEELVYMSPALSESAVRRHLTTLQADGIVRERVLDHRVRDYPNKVYELTEESRARFDERGYFPQNPWRRQYTSVEKTDRIRNLEAMPRPGGTDRRSGGE